MCPNYDHVLADTFMYMVQELFLNYTYSWPAGYIKMQFLMWTLGVMITICVDCRMPSRSISCGRTCVEFQLFGRDRWAERNDVHQSELVWRRSPSMCSTSGSALHHSRPAAPLLNQQDSPQSTTGVWRSDQIILLQSQVLSTECFKRSC